MKQSDTSGLEVGGQFSGTPGYQRDQTKEGFWESFHIYPWLEVKGRFFGKMHLLNLGENI